MHDQHSDGQIQRGYDVIAQLWSLWLVTRRTVIVRKAQQRTYRVIEN